MRPPATGVAREDCPVAMSPIQSGPVLVRRGSHPPAAWATRAGFQFEFGEYLIRLHGIATQSSMA